MRRALFIILFWSLANPAFASYSYLRSITVAHGQVSTNNQTQFPILVCGNGASPCNVSISGLTSVSNGGHVNYTSGNDIIFTTDSTCTIKLTWEMEKYSATTGEFEFWVTNTSTALSHTADTTFYMCYGNSGQADSFQSTASAVWDSSYKGVWHLPDPTNPIDSTGANNGTNHSSTATAGKIDGGVAFASSHYVTTPLIPASNFTVSLWYNTSTNYSGAYGFMFGNAGRRNYYLLMDASAGIQPNRMQMYMEDSGGGSHAAEDTTTSNDGAWHYVVGTFDGSNLKLYMEGGARTITTPAAVTAGTPTGSNYIGIYADGSSFPFTGSMDEVRVSNVARPADWITTEYNNQSAPSSFYTISSEMNGPHQNLIGGVSIIGGTSVIN